MTPVYGACFWGYNSPGCFLWARVLDSGRARGRVYIQADYKFTRKPVEDVAKAIKAKSYDLGVPRLTAIYAHPKMFPKANPSKVIIEAETPSESFARHGLPMIPAGSNDAHGWQRVHDYLRDAPDGLPWLIISPDCRTLARTLPSLVQSNTDPDDCDGDTYAAHALRCLLSARPSPHTLAKTKAPYAWGTVGWLRKLDERKEIGVLSR